MARAPRGSGVSKTSGQGISRLGYQKAYALKGGAASGMSSGFSAGLPSSGGPGSGNRYAKTIQVKADKIPAINVSYGNTYEPGDLQDVQALGKLQAPKPSAGLGATKAKKWSK